VPILPSQSVRGQALISCVSGARSSSEPQGIELTVIEYWCAKFQAAGHPQILLVATPWKNGGGMTHEAIRVPASSDPFRWRVSVAHVDASGPFSELAEYNRKMVLLQGAGIELRFGDETHKTLRKSVISRSSTGPSQLIANC